MTHCHSVSKRLRIAIPLTASIFLIEFVGGIWSGSLALLSDSLHVLFDATALILSYIAIVMAARPATDRHSYGLHRMEILAALINGVVLFATSGWILYESVERFFNPQGIHTAGMLLIAAVGFAVNLAVTFLLHQHHHHDLNVRSAYLHVLGDTLASAAVIIGGIVMHYTGWYAIDPVLGFAIGILLVWGSGRLVYESLHILMEGVPRGMTVEEVVEAVKAIPGVGDFHRVHIWSLCSHIRALSAHIIIDGSHDISVETALEKVNTLLEERYHITHTTLQSECLNCNSEGHLVTPLHPSEPGGHSH
jgi:cobalt-zinc-cadmium efflux system protein